jgi:hypothetical protein
MTALMSGSLIMPTILWSEPRFFYQTHRASPHFARHLNYSDFPKRARCGLAVATRKKQAPFLTGTTKPGQAVGRGAVPRKPD